MEKKVKLIEKRKKVLTLITGIVIITTVFLSCEKDKNISANGQTTSTNPLLKYRQTGITQRNGHLVFNSREEFENTLNWLCNANESAKDAWESNFSGFQSMRSRFNLIVDAEKAIAQNYENMSAAELASINTNVIEHAPITLANMSMLKISYTDGVGFFDKNIHYEPISNLVDSRGLVTVDKIIYKLSFDHIKAITDGDENKIPLLDGINSSSITAKIAVMGTVGLGANFFIIAGGTKGPGNPNPPNPPTNDCSNVWDKQTIADVDRDRLILYINFEQHPDADPSAPYYNYSDFWATARSLKKRLGGIWYDNEKADIWMDGNYTFNYSPRDVLVASPYCGYGCADPVVEYNTHTMYKRFCYDHGANQTCWSILQGYHRATRSGGASGVSAIVSY